MSMKKSCLINFDDKTVVVRQESSLSPLISFFFGNIVTYMRSTWSLLPTYSRIVTWQTRHKEKSIKSFFEKQ